MILKKKLLVQLTQPQMIHNKMKIKVKTAMRVKNTTQRSGSDSVVGPPPPVNTYNSSFFKLKSVPSLRQTSRNLAVVLDGILGRHFVIAYPQEWILELGAGFILELLRMLLIICRGTRRNFPMGSVSE